MTAVWRTALAITIATMCGWLVALAHVGLLRCHLPPVLKLAVVIAGGLVAACVRGRSWFARRAYAMPFLLYSGLLVLSTSFYARGKASMLTIELVIPATASAVPFALSYRAANRVVARVKSSHEDTDGA